MKKRWAWFEMWQEPPPGRIIYKGTYSHTVTQQYEHLNKNQNNKSWDYTYKAMEVVVCQLK